MDYHTKSAPCMLLLSVLLLTACQSTRLSDLPNLISWTRLVADQQLAGSGQWAIDNSASLYIVLPDDGNLDETMHGQLTTVFKTYYPHARAGIYRESLEQSFISAQYAGLDFIVFPRLHLIREKSGLDKVWREEIYLTEVEMGLVEMDILVFAANGRQIVDHLRLETRGGLMTRDHVGLLWQPLSDYLQKLSQFGLAGN